MRREIFSFFGTTDMRDPSTLTGAPYHDRRRDSAVTAKGPSNRVAWYISSRKAEVDVTGDAAVFA
jgi:hypothetical protein